MDSDGDAEDGDDAAEETGKHAAGINRATPVPGSDPVAHISSDAIGGGEGDKEEAGSDEQAEGNDEEDDDDSAEEEEEDDDE